MCRRNNLSRGSPPTAVFVSLVGAAGLILWFLRKKRHENSEKLPDKDSNNNTSQVRKSNRSPFKFPAGTGGKATTAATAGLPRNKASSNKKKNKAKRRAEKAEKAQRKEEQYVRSLMDCSVCYMQLLMFLSVPPVQTFV